GSEYVPPIDVLYSCGVKPVCAAQEIPVPSNRKTTEASDDEEARSRSVDGVCDCPARNRANQDNWQANLREARPDAIHRCRRQSRPFRDDSESRLQVGHGTRN